MSAPQPPRPAPPKGYATWLDYVVSSNDGWVYPDAHPRAELAELRQALADTKAQLALQSANTVEAMAQRDEAKQEVVELRAQVERVAGERAAAVRERVNMAVIAQDAEARFVGAGNLLQAAKQHQIEIIAERDSLRAQVAELRGAVLGLDEFVWCEKYKMWEIRSSNQEEVDAHNALVAKLRAEAPVKQQENPVELVGIPRDAGHVHWCGWCKKEIGTFPSAEECFASDRAHSQQCEAAPFAKLRAEAVVTERIKSLIRGLLAGVAIDRDSCSRAFQDFAEALVSGQLNQEKP